MKPKAYFLVSGLIFFVVAGAHLSRLVQRWDISLGSWHAPYWASVPGLLIPGLLAVWGFRLASKTPA